MKVTWEFDGTTEKSKIIIKDDSKICSECNGYDGHFAECSKLKEILLQERLNEAFKNDKSHTQRLSEN